MVYVKDNPPGAAGDTPGLDTWLEAIGRERSPADRDLLRRAAECAARAHDGQLRASGEPYLRHVMAVADVLNDLHLDTETIVAALLHDVVEDTAMSLDDLRREFGDVIARLVDGVTKMGRISDLHDKPDLDGNRGDQGHAESLRKLLLAMAEDVRVVLIKLADRLHNMRTLKHLDPERQQRIARETMDIYAPLANRLGIWQIKWELEDLALRYLEPDSYRQIARYLDERRVDREAYIERVMARLRRELANEGVPAEVSGRPKHIYSIWRKMRRKNVDFHQVFDVRAIRILVKSVADCYAALGVVHSLWHHIPKEFDDYIANPKENDYRSLHTAVIGPEGKTLEVQIRSYDMHRHAELGVAAHWRYKEGARFDPSFEQKIGWLRQLLEWKEEEPSASAFVDRFKGESVEERVYVLTPRGQVVDLPQGATPLDFAYYIHTDVGNRCRGAKVDGRIVPLTYELRNGQQVEVLTARHGVPSRDWLNPQLGYLKTSRARAKARHWFKLQDHEKNVAAGRAALDRELHRMGISGLSLDRLAERFHAASTEDFLAAIGSGDINTGQLASAAHELVAPAAVESAIPGVRAERTPATTTGAIEIRGVGNLLTHVARCCNPVPDDPIVGYITRGRGVTIHRRDCANALRLAGEDRERMIEVEWGGRTATTYPVEILIDAYDRQGLLRDITALLANDKINVTGVNTYTDKRDHVAHMSLGVEIADISQLSRVLNRINQLPNVLEARRRV